MTLLIYQGHGEGIPGVPAQDLSQSEITRLAGAETDKIMSDYGFRFDEEKFIASIEPLRQSINQLAVIMSEAFQPLIKSINKLGWTLFNSIGWRRLPYETDEMYAERLVTHGWLDNPDARWEYQKIVLTTPIRLLMRWIRQ